MTLKRIFSRKVTEISQRLPTDGIPVSDTLVT